MSETSEQMKTSEAARLLGVSENTLRKYSQAAEKVAGPAYFPRVKNARRYRPEDLDRLRHLQELVKEGKTVDQAAREVFAGEAADPAPSRDQLQAELAARDKEIADLKAQLARLTEQAAAPAPEATDLPDLADDFLTDEPLTPEQKRAEVVADMAKSDQEVHEELLSRSLENAAKGTPTHRTLADMQLASKKRPWWKRLFK